jgi:hypothetical protein
VLLGTPTRLSRLIAEDCGDYSPYLLHKVSLEFLIQSSIVPSAVSLTRFKIDGNLPRLHVNFSDEKYKSLMRIIDSAIPNFEAVHTDLQTAYFTAAISAHSESALKLQENLFSESYPEYQIMDVREEPANSLQSNLPSVSLCLQIILLMEI